MHFKWGFGESFPSLNFNIEEKFNLEKASA
jgi:hypothetical protein